MPGMSRRSRRQQGNPGGSTWLARVMISLIVLTLLAAGLLYAAVRGYLHSEGFRQLLSEKVSKAAGVSGEFTPFRWDGLAVDTDAFQATGEGTVQGVRLDGMHTEIGLGGLRRGAWEIRDARVQRMEIAIDAAARDALSLPPMVAQVVESAPVRTSGKQGWLPREVELHGLEFGEVVLRANLKQGPVSASGIKVAVEPAGAKHSYRGELTGGTIQLPFSQLPELRLDHARLRYQDGTVFLTSAALEAWSEGRITASGEWDRNTRLFSLEGGLSKLKCEEILDENWAKRLIGEINADFSLGNHSGKPQARGELAIHHGMLTALPVLDALAAYADTRRFRTIPLSEAQALWTWEKDLIELNEIVLSSEGLMRLEGRVIIRGSELDGTFRLGLVPGVLATLPGAETHVFAPGERGLLWAPLRLTGTVDKPKEDLTDRLILAAGMRILESLPENADEVINLTRSLLGADPAKAVEKGARLIEKSGLDVREVSGILDSLLGGGRRKAPEPEPEAPPQPAVPEP